MTKREVFQLLRMIASFYEQFELDQQKVDAWYMVLKNYAFEFLEKNLLTHVAESSYPPKVSELIRKPAKGARAIPDCLETEYTFSKSERSASDRVVEENLAKMREILGIKRGER